MLVKILRKLGNIWDKWFKDGLNTIYYYRIGILKIEETVYWEKQYFIIH